MMTSPNVAETPIPPSAPAWTVFAMIAPQPAKTSANAASASASARRSRSGRSISSGQPCTQLLQGVGQDVVVGPQAVPLDAEDLGLAQLAQVMRERRLGDVEQRLQLARADLPGVFAQHVHE